ncbi:hypothetical protein V8C44DRAFT_340603 [Trichoderma aethiopicum]
MSLRSRTVFGGSEASVPKAKRPVKGRGRRRPTSRPSPVPQMDIRQYLGNHVALTDRQDESLSGSAILGRHDVSKPVSPKTPSLATSARTLRSQRVIPDSEDDSGDDQSHAVTGSTATSLFSATTTPGSGAPSSEPALSRNQRKAIHRAGLETQSFPLPEQQQQQQLPVPDQQQQHQHQYQPQPQLQHQQQQNQHQQNQQQQQQNQQQETYQHQQQQQVRLLWEQLEQQQARHEHEMR